MQRIYKSWFNFKTLAGLNPLQPTTGTECAVRRRGEGSVRWPHRVDVARSSAGWLSARAQCVARC
jgi:hypothetical protein